MAKRRPTEAEKRALLTIEDLRKEIAKLENKLETYRTGIQELVRMSKRDCEVIGMFAACQSEVVDRLTDSLLLEEHIPF